MTESIFSRLEHMGVVVRDLDKAIEYYQSLGIGPFEVIATDTITDKTMYGKPMNWKMKAAIAQMGPIKFELIEPVEDAPLWEEFLERGGEGINHLAFVVDDCAKETAKLTNKGLKVVQTARFESGGSCAFFDTREVGGVIIELIQW